MGKKVALIVTHGMGDVTKQEFKDRVGELKDDLKDRMGSSSFSKVVVKPVFFQDILQRNQNKVFRAMKDGADIDWIKLRRFMLYSFCDAASLEHRAHVQGSVYFETQQRILNALASVYGTLDVGSKQVVFLAHSLGGQVVSNYIWDSQQTNPSQGAWSVSQSANAAPGSAKEDFLKLKGMKYLITTGCNIPLFVAGQKPIQAVVNDQNGYQFKWHNFYDEDDVLGWPLKPLGKQYSNAAPGKSYAKAVAKDHEINANGGALGYLLKSWNPFSHGEYWEDRDFLQFLSDRLSRLT